MADIIREGFETDGNGTRYATSVPEFSDGAGDFFTRTDGTNIGAFIAVAGQTGQFWFGASDIDGEGAASRQTLTFTGIDIAGFTGLGLSVDLAEDDDGTNEDWDAADFVHFDVSIDGSAFQPVLWVEGANFTSVNGTSNGAPLIDTDFDGEGDGTEITATFQTFGQAIAGTGSTLDLRVTFDLDSGDEDIAIDEIAITGTNSSAGPALAIADVQGAEDGGPITVAVTLDQAVAGGFSVDASTLDGTATVADGDYTAVTSRTLTFAGTAGETQTFTITPTPDATFEADETLSVSLSNLVGTTQSVDIADTGTVTILNDDPRPLTLISAVQGAGDASPLAGQTVTVEAVVVGDFQDGAGANGDLNGFYIQEEDADADGDVATSEGLFVFDGSSPAIDVNVGDTVRVTGTVGEGFGQTQLSDVTVSVVASGGTLPTAALLETDANGAFGDVVVSGGEFVLDLEQYEGMLVTTDEVLTVADLFGYGRFGEIGANSGGRLPIFTQVNDPDPTGAALTAYQRDATARTLLIDDGRTGQNPTTLPYPDGSYDAADELRSGDTITSLTGVLGFGFGAYRVQPTEAPTFVNSNPRPVEAPDVGGELTVASFNVLNFFTTLDQGGNTTATGAGPRGAESAAEYQRQLDKLVAAISEIDADVLGLIEIENEFGSDQNGDGLVAIEALVAALNAQMGAGTYAAVDPGVGTIGTDAIAVGMIYKPASVTTLGSAAIADSTTAPGFDDTVQRPTLIQSFAEVGTGEAFTAAVNHFKSKGSVVNGEFAIGDGQGNNNPTRTAAAEAVVDYLATDPTGAGTDNVVILGDLNAYALEDPITAIREGADDVAGTADDFTDLLGAFSTSGDGFAYTYGFPVSLDTAPLPQAFGTLDYALASVSFTGQVTGAAAWHTNADEPAFIDYNLNFKNLDPYAPTPFRSSDHDAVLVGLTLDADVELFAGGARIGRFGAFEAAEAAAGAGDEVRILDAVAIGDLGTPTVSTDSLVVRADAPVTGTLKLANDGRLFLAGTAALDVEGRTTDGGVPPGGQPGDRIVGNAGDNVIRTGASNDSIEGGAGNDVLIGGAGDDVLGGGRGADVLRGGDGFDRAFYGRATGSVGVDVEDGANGSGEGAGDTFDSIEAFTLSAAADAFAGGTTGEFVRGLGGDDVIDGRGGNDTILGDGGNDVVSGGEGADRLTGGAGDDMLFGGVGNDVLFGGAGADALDGGEGRDVAFYGTASAAVGVNVAGGPGAGEGAGDTFANVEVFRLSGFDDVFVGSSAVETVFGGAGADTLDGGAGNDLLFGEAGGDAFAFATGHGIDAVADFTRGDDRIDLVRTTASDFDDLLIIDVADSSVVAIDVDGNGVADNDDRIRLVGVSGDDLAASDFVFSGGVA